MNVICRIMCECNSINSLLFIKEESKYIHEILVFALSSLFVALHWMLAEIFFLFHSYIKAVLLLSDFAISTD